jgi:hypothetical protein
MTDQAGRPSNASRGAARRQVALTLRVYADQLGMSMSVAAAKAIIEEPGDPFARLRAIRDAEIRRQRREGGWTP